MSVPTMFETAIEIEIERDSETSWSFAVENALYPKHMDLNEFSKHMCELISALDEFDFVGAHRKIDLIDKYAFNTTNVFSQMMKEEQMRTNDAITSYIYERDCRGCVTEKFSVQHPKKALFWTRIREFLNDL